MKHLRASLIIATILMQAPSISEAVKLNRSGNIMGGAGVSTFIALTDTPSSFVGEGGKVVRVNIAEDALEYVVLAGGGDMLKATYDTEPDNKIDAAAGGTNIDTSAATGVVIITAGVWSAVDPLTVPSGGTGAATFTDGGILLGSGVGAFTPLGVAANGQIPIGDAATDPVLNEIDGTANEVTLTNGAGTITVSLPDPIVVNVTGNVTGALTGNADTATLASTVTVSDDEATNDNQEIVFTTDNTNLESDGDFHYNPSTGTVTATVFAGALTGAVTGNADTATALAANGANCGAGQWAQGVDASGAAEGCTAIDLDDVAENDGSTDVAIDITATNAATIPLTLTGAAAQSTFLFVAELDGGTDVFNIWQTGHINNIDGMRTVAAQYGPAYWSHIYGEGAPEHTNQTGSYDHTGGANGEMIFTKTAGDDFHLDDEDNGNWILLTGTNLGAVAEIKDFVSTTQVIVDGMDWDGDLASQTFLIYKHPGFVSGDGFKHEFSVGATGEVEIHSYGFTGTYMFEVENDIASNDTDTVLIEANANGYNSNSVLKTQYNSGTLGVGELGGGIQSTIDVSEAVGADSTTLVASYIAAVIDGSSTATKQAYVALAGFDEAFRVIGAVQESPDYGYEVASGAVTDRVNSGPGDGAAFDSAADDVIIFDATNDYVLIGMDLKI